MKSPFSRISKTSRGLLGAGAALLALLLAWLVIARVRGAQSWVRESRYVRMRDGTAIAVDIYRPARGGVASTEPLPALLTDYRYQRAMIEGGKLLTPLDGSERFRAFLKHGYVVAVADLRGTGASFGVSRGPFASIEADDAHDLIEWLASQRWCDGEVGMFGSSYSGTVQMLAAAAAPPHLKAIFPEMFIFDLYEVAYPGGVPRSPFVRNWSQLVGDLDTNGRVAPVAEGGPSGLSRALEEHRQNVTPYEMLALVPFRDSRDPHTREAIFESRSPERWLSAVNQAQIPVYALSGFADLWPKDALLWFRNLRVPKKITIGPWSHNDRTGFDRTTEQLRWFDHWLKHRDNGVNSEDPVRYYTSGARAGWRVASAWPPPNTVTKTWSLCAGSSSHGLCERPASETAQDNYRVDYDATTGTKSRWANGYGAEFSYPDLATNDAKLLTYTSAALDAELETTGHPIARLWITADAPDVDLVLYLEDVSPNGESRYVTEGVLRASHRGLATPSYDDLALPFHASRERDLEPLGPEASEVQLDLAPISYRFGVGHRIRLALAGADRDNLETRTLEPPPTLTVHRGGAQPSALELPVLTEANIRMDAARAQAPIAHVTIASGLLALGLLCGALHPAMRRRFRNRSSSEAQQTESAEHSA